MIKDVNTLLESAHLLSYKTVFKNLGGDDLEQICNANETEFAEICKLVGMDSKPLHVVRFRKAIDEARKIKPLKKLSDQEKSFFSTGTNIHFSAFSNYHREKIETTMPTSNVSDISSISGF